MVYHLVQLELYTIASNRRYMLSLAVQLLLLFAIIPVFSTFFSTGSISITTPALNEFVPVGVVDNSPDSRVLRGSLERNNKIDLFYLREFDEEALENGKVAAILLIPVNYDESLNRVLELELTTNAANIKSGAVYDAVYPSIQEASSELSQIRRDAFGISVEEPLKVEKRYLKPLVVREGESRFSTFFLTYLVPLMLFFPLFTVGSIILDSVVGERERKTFESLLVSPIKRSDAVIAKFLSISIFVLIQVALWLIVLEWFGAPIKNRAVALIFIMIIDSAIISTALLLAYYSRTVKEANILLMLLYTFVFIFLIISLSINYFDTSILSTPFTAVSDLVTDDGATTVFWPTALLLVTGLALATNIKLNERDDIVFGPRPDLKTLLQDLSIWLFTSGPTGYIQLTLIFGIFSIAYATLIEIMIGIPLIFTFGFTPLLVPLFAFIEEALKPAGLYFLSAKKKLQEKEAIALGFLSGFMFFLLESIFFLIATYYLFPERMMMILRLRISTTLIVHMIGSGIVAYGVVKKNYFIYLLLLATLFHSLFNLVVTGGLP